MSAHLSAVAGGRAVSSGVEYHPPQETRQVRGGEGAPPGERSLSVRVQGGHLRPLPPAHRASPHVVVGKRVDWLSAAFRVSLDEQLVEDVTREAMAWGRVAVTLGGIAFEAKKMRTGKRLLFRNGDVGIVVDPEGPEGWTVQVDCPGEFMARTSMERAVEISRHLAASLGEVVGERARRLDLCADVAGLDIRDVDIDGWVKPSRARVERASVEDVEKAWEYPELRQYHRGGRLTGYTICPGNPLSCVVYDKLEELATMRPDKLQAETSVWRANGWNGNAAVTRIEFRLRSEALHQLGCRDGLSRVLEKLDAIWGYCSRMWLRLVLPWTHSRIARCELHPAWEEIRKVTFVHAVSPALRIRLRGGVSAGHALGAVFSLVGAQHKMPQAMMHEGDLGEILEGQHLAEKETRASADVLVRQRVAALFGRAARVVSKTMVQALGPRQALAMLLEREGATRARFSSISSMMLSPPKKWYGRKRLAA
jgi:hypothetical protein